MGHRLIPGSHGGRLGRSLRTLRPSLRRGLSRVGQRAHFGAHVLDPQPRRPFERMDAVRHAAFEVARRRLHVRLKTLEFVELDFAVDVGLDVVHVALHAAQQQARRACHARQPLGADHHQRNDGDERQFGKADEYSGKSGNA